MNRQKEISLKTKKSQTYEATMRLPPGARSLKIEE